ncbi:long-chain-fatty-acid--CoA ligase [Lachnospiraceae bacterium]|nr:acyl--CoA ligase [Lachnospiraceae bacterium]GFI31441.1 long-chain-fatty-acid--CoA ligase [Lachnospiraceae bacterium]
MLYKALIEEHINKQEDRVAVIYQEEEYSYKELNDLVAAFGNGLTSLGINKGDRIIITCNNSIDMVVSILASIALGIIFVPLPHDISKSRLEYIQNDCKAKLIINNRYRKRGTASGDNMCCLKDVINVSAESNFHREIVDINEGLYIIYTSGTTNKPKGVFACQKQALFVANAINGCLRNSVDDIILCRIPLSFDYGLYQLLMTCLSGAKLLLLDEQVMIQSIPQMIKKYNVTALPVVPAMLNILIKSRVFERVDVPSVRYISSTGDVLSVGLIKQTEQQLPHVEVIPMYGLTECKRVSIMPYGMKEKKYKGSCGIPLPGVSVRLVNEHDGVGELEVIGPNVMEGYWNDSVETEKFYSVEEGERVLKTGDLFKIDEDGYLYFQGREKAFIKHNGYRINNLELEEIVASIDNVMENAVVGINDSDAGEDIVCVISLNDMTKEAQIRKDCIKSLGGIKVKHFIFTDEPLPKNFNGKVDRKLIKSNIEARR